MKRLNLLIIFILSFGFKANAGVIQDFNISLNFSSNANLALTHSQQNVFYQAKSIWEHLIVGYDNNVVGPGLSINAYGQDIDGPGNILGQAGPTFGLFAPKNVYATQGVMSFDRADLSTMEAEGDLLAVIVHEMAHVIGFGTLWDEPYNDLYDDNNNYIGKYGLAAYQSEFDPNASFVPVEQEGGEGTAGGHWDEAFGGAGGDNRIMTGWLNANPYISLTTINSFRDLGYVINSDYIFGEIPEPSTNALLLLAFVGMLTRRKIRNTVSN